MIYLLSIIGSILYRLRGMDTDYRIGWRILFGVVLGLSVSTDPLIVLSVLVISYLGIVIGHGSYFPRNGYCIDDEPFKFITRLIEDPMGAWTRRIGMVLTGCAITLPVIFASEIYWLLSTALLYALSFIWWIFSFGEINFQTSVHIDISYWYALAGFMKPVGYEIGFYLHQKRYHLPHWFPVHNAFGEWWWGFWSVLMLILATL